MTYKRSLLSGEDNPTAIKEWADKEFRQIENEFNLQDFLYLSKRNVAPAKPKEGMTAFADGTNWNPGGGKGVYTYYNGTWNKLG